MKNVVFLIIAVLLGISRIGAAEPERELIRKPGHYSLDGNGGTLVIAKQPAGWTLKATWGSGDGSSSVTPDNCLRTEGWFVFVEKPGRIWVFDGREEPILLSHSEKETKVSSFSRDVVAACPRKFWDALPQDVRAKYQKIKPLSAGKRS